jgi:hypothetical protein
LGLLLLARGEPEEAAGAFLAALAGGAVRHAGTYAALARAQARLGAAAGERAAIDAGLAALPGDPRLLLVLGDCLARTVRVRAGASEAYRRAAEHAAPGATGLREALARRVGTLQRGDRDAWVGIATGRDHYARGGRLGRSPRTGETPSGGPTTTHDVEHLEPWVPWPELLDAVLEGATDALPAPAG